MIKPKKLKKGDKVAIVSLSRGLLGNDSIKHELDIALKRLKDYGLVPVIMPNALQSYEYLYDHPEARAQDLKDAFADDSIKAIICAIGGFDTFRTYEYLMNDEEFINNVKNHPKIFTGFSDTTMNHLMFFRLGMESFYGPCVIVDLAELDNEMLPYTKEHFEKFFKEENGYEIKSSDKWYHDRESYGVEQIGTSRIVEKEENGYEILNGSGKVSGILYGGCIDSIFNAYVGSRFDNKFSFEPEMVERYNIMPTLEEWKNIILFIETSELKPTPEEFRDYLNELKGRNILSSIKGLFMGKPAGQVYYEEYKAVIKEVFKDLDTPIIYNVNFGHCLPRCLIPYGAKATLDLDNKKITVDEAIFEK